MKLGFVSAILADQSLDQVLDFAAAEGFSCIELMCWPVGKAERRYAGVTHVDVADFDQAKAEATRALADKYGVSAERIRQLEGNAMKKLKAAIAA